MPEPREVLRHFYVGELARCVLKIELIMNNTITSIMIGGSMLAAVPASAEVEFEVHTGYHSIYEFRGVDLGDDLIEGGVDFSTDLGNDFSLSGGAWYADTSGGKFNELDLYVGLTKTWGKVDISAGYIYYALDGALLSDTQEVYLGVSTELACGLGLSLTYFEDVDTIDGGYLEFAASKSYELSACISLDLAVGAAWSFGYNTDVDGTSLEGFNHYYAKVALPWNVYGDWTLTPYAKFVGASNSIANGFAVANEDLFIGGVTLSYSF